MRRLTAVVLGVASVLTASPADAVMSPIGLAIVPPAQLPPQRFTVAGVRLSALWGSHASVYGLDFGLIGNRTEANFGGLAVAGGFNWNKGMTTVWGLQAAGLANINENKARIVGVQIAGALNSNQAESTLVGLQVALANLSPNTTVYGFQVGVFNQARTVNGFQVGLINSTNALRGIQIGLLNFNTTGLFAVAPILNVGF